jgi:hypothetical protein
VQHWVGKTKMTAKTNQVIATGFKPSLVTIDGNYGNVVTSSASGLVYLRKITGNYGAQHLGAPVRLPTRLISPSTLAATHVGNSLRIYSTSKTTADLTEIIVPNGHPEKAKAYRIASSGFGTLANLVPGVCWGTYGHDVQLVGISTRSGNAVLFRHKNSVNHGPTLTTKIKVGAAGGWKNWSGIGD